jgi:hypothetical protein
MVLLSYIAAEDGILMPQPLKLAGGGGGALLVRHQMCTLLHAYPGSVVLEVEQVLCRPGQQSHPGVEVRALEVEHGLKALLPYGVLLIPNQEKRDRQCCYRSEAVLTQGGEGDVLMTDPDHDSVGSKGIITLTSHLSKPWAMGSR